MCEFNQMFLRVFSYLNKKLFIFKVLKCYILNPVIVLNDYSGHVKASSPSHQSLKGWHLKSVVETLGLSFRDINHKWASYKCSFGPFSAICWMIRHYRLCSHEWEDGCLPMIFVCVWLACWQPFTSSIQERTFVPFDSRHHCLVLTPSGDPEHCSKNTNWNWKGEPYVSHISFSSFAPC